MSETRYTLTMKSEIYEELRVQAELRGTTIKDLVRQFMRLGLVALKSDLGEDPRTGIFIKELDATGAIRETKLIIG